MVAIFRCFKTTSSKGVSGHDMVNGARRQLPSILRNIRWRPKQGNIIAKPISEDLLSVVWVPVHFYTKIVLLYKTACFLRLSTKNHAESFWNYIKKLFPHRNRAKLDEKSEFRHVHQDPKFQNRVKSFRKTLPLHGFDEKL